MRSELVFGAMENVPNRFLLAKLAAKATRKFHRPHTRVEETVNEVLVRFNCACPIQETQNIAKVQLFRRGKQTLLPRTAQAQAVA
jgi:hypothetical protein